MTVFDGDSAISVNNLVEPIQINIPSTSHVFMGQPVCAWWDEATSSWSKSGCTYAISGASTDHVCLCTHLTDFAVLDSALMAGPLPVWALALIALGGAIISILVVLFIVRRVRVAMAKRNKDAQFTAVRLMSQDELAAAAAGTRPQV